MFKSIKDFFETQLLKSEQANKDTNTPSLELAAAVLMLEISLADSTIHEAERKVIEEAMQNSFSLSENDASTLIALAEQEVDHAVSLHDFTTLINRVLSREDRSKIVEMLWKVAFADAVLDKYEEYFIRKIADLLYVSHTDYIRAKLKASGESLQAPGN